MTRFFFNSPLIHGYLGYYPNAGDVEQSVFPEFDQR